ncbi:MAG: 16S rRNA (cytidine(1402)-2'-O)-methyltransferase [Clostridia bacterium]
MIYFVATPIGNLSDISFRAIETLKNVDIIACEDTRNSLKLLQHYEINKPLIAHHKHNEKSSTEGILELNRQGKNIAIISDGGMPLISDPGETLAVRLKEEKIPFSVVPGANAGLCALILSGLPSFRFAFIGFLPEKQKEKIEVLEEHKRLKGSLIFHISPHNIEKDLLIIFKQLGARKACLVKEISKIYEQATSFVLGDKIEINEKGEFVLVVEGFKEESTNGLNMEEEYINLIKCGIDKNEAIKMIAQKFGVKKNEVYQIAISIKI